MSRVSPVRSRSHSRDYLDGKDELLFNFERQNDAEEGEKEIDVESPIKRKAYSSSDREGNVVVNFKRQKYAEESDLEVESSPEDSTPQDEGNSEELVEEQEESCEEEEDEESQEIAEEERGDVASSFSESTLNVTMGQMSIPSDRLDLYKCLINNFGEIVSPNLPKYKLSLTNTALTDLLNVVREIIVMTPMDVSKEKVLELEDMVSFYSGMGLKMNWLLVRVKRYNDWLVRRSKVDVNQMEGKVIVKRKTLEAKRKEVSTLENELHDLCAELETERSAQSHFNFSFFDK